MPYVLVVEDELELADLTAEMLRQEGYEALTVPNGFAALHALARRRADLVLLDLMLPMMSGNELLREMRQHLALQDIPVVIVTAMPEAIGSEADNSYAALIEKPFRREALMAIVARFVSRHAGGE